MLYNSIIHIHGLKEKEYLLKYNSLNQINHHWKLNDIIYFKSYSIIIILLFSESMLFIFLQIQIILTYLNFVNLMHLILLFLINLILNSNISQHFLFIISNFFLLNIMFELQPLNHPSLNNVPMQLSFIFIFIILLFFVLFFPSILLFLLHFHVE